jgi:hypothetical protein
MYGCRDVSGCAADGFCARLASMPPLDLDQLRFPRDSTILIYGHSYLREVSDNMLHAHPDEIEAVSDIEYVGVPAALESGACGDFKHAEHIVFKKRPRLSHTANEACLQNRKKDKTGSLGYNPTKFSELKIHQSIVEVRYAARNTTVLHVINNGTLQNPFCLDVLDRFLTKYGHIDVAVFMKPHGGAFNTYTRLKAAGKDVGDWKPVDLSTMTSEGAQVPIADLAKILGGHADHLVYVEPWNMPSGTSNSKDPAKADRESKMQVENDATASAITDMVGPIFNLNDYVWARLGAETPYRGGMCVSGMGHSQCGNTSGHQCQPGALTVAAVALNRRVHTLMGRQWPEPILLQQSNPVPSRVSQNLIPEKGVHHHHPH